MNKYVIDFVGYFEYLCTQHPALLHNNAVAGAQVFAVRPLEQAFSDFRSANSERGYAVRLVLPTFSMSGNSQPLKDYQVGLLVIRKYSLREGNELAAITAASEAEAVFDSMIARVVNDAAEGLALFSGFNSTLDELQINGDYFFHEGDGSWAGVFATLQLKAPRLHHACNGVAWTDGGVTPP